MKTDAKLHVREYGGILAVAEKKTLIWLAGRMPRRVNSDHLTLLGLIAMILAGASFWAAGQNSLALLLVVFFLALNWFGDSLDGTLARYRNRQRPRYGYYVDHVIDLIGTTALLGGLALSGYMSPLIALSLLVVFLLLEAEVYLATHVLKVFRLGSFGFGPTELRILLSIGVLYLLYNPRVYIAGHGPYLLFDVGGVIAIAGMLIVLFFSAARNTITLYKEETPANPASNAS
ncbi:MAG: CDP-alcohol phosphatidyltransferase family protein [Acidobacteria bacterium]|nr:CDP-alcohol phosphatidyltransferase family protein [Acidobacteriota bacterium]